MDKKDLEELKELAKRIRNVNKKFLLLKLLRKAKQEYDNNNFEGCMELCQKILESNPENSIALRGLGCCYQVTGDDETALKYYEQALRHSSAKEIEYTLMGTIYYNKNNYDKAIECYNLAIDANENYEVAYEERNQTMLERHLEIADLQDELIKREIL